MPKIVSKTKTSSRTKPKTAAKTKEKKAKKKLIKTELTDKGTNNKASLGRGKNAQKIEKLEKQVANLQTKLKSCKAELTNSREAEAKLKAEFENSDEWWEAELETLRNKLEEQRRAHEKTGKRLQECDTERKTLKNELAVLVDQVNRLTNENGRLKRRQ